MLKRLALLTLTAFCLFVVGCAPPWTVIKQAEPNPFTGKKEFVVMPVDYSGLKIGEKTEEEYLGAKEEKAEEKGKESKTRESLQTDKEEVSNRFQDHLKKVSAKDGISVNLATGEVTTFVIKPHIGFMEPGFYAYVASRPSEIVMTLKIEDKDGKLLDEIEIKHRTEASMINAAAGTRYRKSGDAIGDIVGEYIRLRVRGEK